VSVKATLCSFIELKIWVMFFATHINF